MAGYIEDKNKDINYYYYIVTSHLYLIITIGYLQVETFC